MRLEEQSTQVLGKIIQYLLNNLSIIIYQIMKSNKLFTDHDIIEYALPPSMPWV
jgi:ATP:corrinoid adenosyltransferase